MAYMKRNVNFGFFLLLMATLLSLAGLSIYYQTTFKNLYTDYRSKLDDLNNVSTTLSTERAKLEQTSQELNIKEAREKELSTQYTGLKTEKEKISAEKASLQNQLTAKTNELVQRRAELFTTNQNLATAQSELSTTKTNLTDAQTTISELEQDINDLESERNNLSVQLAACQSQYP